MRKTRPATSKTAALVDGIGRKTGAGLPPVRRKAVVSALLDVAESHGLDGIAEIYEKVGNDPELTDEVVAKVTVGETYFFRDPQQFELIRSEVIPDVLHHRASQFPITAWCAGCSTGEEAYSLAILMDQEGLGERVRIIATDISGEALKAARKAEYSEWSLRNADPALRSRFTRRGERFRLDKKIARRVHFARHSLGRDMNPPPGADTARFDLILCRNVLIYMNETAVRAAALQLYESLAEGGWLLAGPSDPPLWNLAPFETEATSSGVTYRRPSLSRSASVDRAPPVSIPSLYAQTGPEQDGPSATIAEQAPAAQPPLQGLTEEKEARLAACRIGALLRAGDSGTVAEAAEATERHPLSAELHYLHGLSLIDAGRREEAVAALRRSIYLDRTLEAARFRMAACLAENDPEAAMKEFDNALAACSARQPQDAVPLMEGVTAAEFTELAAGEIARLQSRSGGSL